MTKHRLRESGLPTPQWMDAGSESQQDALNISDSRWIIKPVWEHASVGMDDEAVVKAESAAELQEAIHHREERLQRPLFAERFVDGREFNLSLLEGDVLPPAEIDFSAFPLDKPRIVGQRAKWEQDSFEYRETPRRFEFPDRDRPLLRELTKQARHCWQLFELSGFARVDFRVDTDGQPWILEVNVNPCLSPDAGFAAALAQAGISYHEALQRIVSEAYESFRVPASTA
jgi:D-alanine-D-alanine ligase